MKPWIIKLLYAFTVLSACIMTAVYMTHTMGLLTMPEATEGNLYMVGPLIASGQGFAAGVIVLILIGKLSAKKPQFREMALLRVVWYAFAWAILAFAAESIVGPQVKLWLSLTATFFLYWKWLVLSVPMLALNPMIFLYALAMLTPLLGLLIFVYVRLSSSSTGFGVDQPNGA